MLYNIGFQLIGNNLMFSALVLQAFGMANTARRCCMTLCPIIRVLLVYLKETPVFCEESVSDSVSTYHPRQAFSPMSYFIVGSLSGVEKPLDDLSAQRVIRRLHRASGLLDGSDDNNITMTMTMFLAPVQ